MKIVIIGGVAGGMSAATRLRRLSESAEITVLERSGYVSFANCGLPYYVGDVIEERSALLLQTPESLRDRFNLDVRVRHDVRGIDAAAQRVRGTDLTTQTEFESPYDALILSPGARPIRPPIPGIAHALTLRNIEATDTLDAAVGDVLNATTGDTLSPATGDALDAAVGNVLDSPDGDALDAATAAAKTAIVIGGGFIGLEVAENLKFRGLDMTLIEAIDQVMAPLDPEMIAPVHAHMREKGVDLVLGQQVTEISPRSVLLKDGTELSADLIVSAVGVQPETQLATDAGLRLGESGGIAVDENFRTSDARVYALGDAAEKTDFLTGDNLLLPLAGPANRQGRRVADVIMNHRSSARRGNGDRRVYGASILKLFDLDIAAVGWNEKRLRAAGRDYRAIHTHPSSHAGYYPGAGALSIKLLFDPATHEILGAQVVGAGNVDKRIDVLATALQAGMRVTELADLELAYAPPFNSAKDPVSMLGYIAETQLDGLLETIQWHELENAMAAGATLVDVRGADEVANGAIPGSVHVEMDDLRDRLASTDVDDPLLAPEVIVHCAVGLRGYFAARVLQQTAADRGIKVRVRNLDGGIRTWEAGTVKTGF